MPKQTTTLDVLRFSWVLWRSRHRTHMRIGQLLENAVNMHPHHSPNPPLFYVENKRLNEFLRQFRC